MDKKVERTPEVEEADNFINAFQLPGMGINQCIQEYEDAEKVKLYEKMASRLNYSGPLYCADLLSGLIQDRANALVLDVGAGTGFVGEELHKRGFRKIVAHDGAQAMLDICREKNVYSSFICSIVDEGYKFPVKNDTYDAVTISGAVCENHLPPSCQAEFIRITKPGGFIINVFRATVLNLDYGRAWENEAKRLVSEKKWTLYGRLMAPGFSNVVDGLVDIYQVN
ncbi:demethylmenaquinone methyltransferase-like [Physella acuta]|uniref:demethylmenaquinone methyltransferase-like n=1 Tax=Physella acuta TaxID=109671 RepID=UPI0027DC7A3B|nr:demethylmenaquinone methyltransferase-like [Physella acuta]